MPRLESKVALVTGAARGIGHAITNAFLEEGAAVVATDIEDAALATAVRESAARPRRLDVRLEADWQAAIEELLEREGRLDVLVNNAGVTGFDLSTEGHDPASLDLELWRAVMATNLDGVALGCKHALRVMRPTGGSIINMGSRSGLVGIPGASAYAASKAAVRNHTRTVALFGAAMTPPVRCNCIQPAAIRTPMWDAMLGEPGSPGYDDRVKSVTADCPLKRFGAPEEVAALAVHLASDESAYTTGAAIDLDGGTLAGAASPPTTD